MSENTEFHEEERTEIINGQVKVMGAQWTNHVLIKDNLYMIFGNYLDEKRPVALSGATVFLQEGVEEYKPDMAVIRNPDILGYDGVYGVPDLVIEILMPWTVLYDRGHKMKTYEKSGVREYWIVDPVNRSIEQYILENGAFILRNVYTHYTENTFHYLKDAEKAAVVTEFQCSLFDDLTIRVEDVFYRVID